MDVRVVPRQISAEGERLPVQTPFVCKGHVEDWLRALVTEMQATVRNQFELAYQRLVLVSGGGGAGGGQFTTTQLHDFVSEFPAQVHPPPPSASASDGGVACNVHHENSTNTDATGHLPCPAHAESCDGSGLRSGHSWSCTPYDKITHAGHPGLLCTWYYSLNI